MAFWSLSPLDNRVDGAWSGSNIIDRDVTAKAWGRAIQPFDVAIISKNIFSITVGVCAASS